jgi:uncharacterized membrane protein
VPRWVKTRAIPIWLVASACSFVYAFHKGYAIGAPIGFTIGWGCVVLGLWYAVESMKDMGSPSAEAILEQRFARGEIDEDEYRRRHRALRLTRDEGNGQG